ncbi:MAG: hemolysin III family protein, partial [Candidatus Margulisbacteria bacterium]|nr:hemolysin III family protein [Candidatus Margulisiibacteriota bacterium]
MKLKDPLPGLLHLIGTILAIPALIILIILNTNSIWKIISFSIYGSSLFLLFLFSTLYHWLPQKAGGKFQVFRKFDHLTIYILIAGTYTPFCLVTLNNTIWGWFIFGLIWGVTIIAVTFQSIFINLPRWLTTTLYIIMGWLILFALNPLLAKLPMPAFGLLLSGGLVYTCGGIIYSLKKP